MRQTHFRGWKAPGWFGWFVVYDFCMQIPPCKMLLCLEEEKGEGIVLQSEEAPSTLPPIWNQNLIEFSQQSWHFPLFQHTAAETVEVAE